MRRAAVGDSAGTAQTAASVAAAQTVSWTGISDIPPMMCKGGPWVISASGNLAFPNHSMAVDGRRRGRHRPLRFWTGRRGTGEYSRSKPVGFGTHRTTQPVAVRVGGVAPGACRPQPITWLVGSDWTGFGDFVAAVEGLGPPFSRIERSRRRRRPGLLAD